MKICYVDEAGCTGSLPSANSDIQPVLALTGTIVDYSNLHQITESTLNLKQKFFPKALPANTQHMGWILHEIKGNEVRRDICSHNRNKRRHGIGYLKKILQLCEDCDIKLIGRVWVKPVGQPMNGVSVYTYSIQSIYQAFQKYLEENDDVGFVVLDSRLKHLNTQVAHSIFTQKFKGTGDIYDRIIELPAFSHSDNHAGLQLCDTICSSLIVPIAIHTYCEGYITGIHIKPGYKLIKDEFADTCRRLQFRYQEASKRTKGGFTISDGLGKRPGGHMFR